MRVLFLALILAGTSVLVLAIGRTISRAPGKRPVFVAIGVCLGYGLLLLLVPEARWLSNLGVLLAAAALGYLISHLLPSSVSVVAFLITAAIIDVVSFSGGLTSAILDSYRAGTSTLLDYLAVFWRVGGQEVAVVGIGDLAILVAAYLGFSRSSGRQFLPAGFLIVGLLSALYAGYAIGGIAGIPFLAAAGLLFLWVDRLRNASKSSPARTSSE